MPKKKSSSKKAPKKTAKKSSAKKAPAKKAATLTGIYNEVSRRADTAGLKISAAESRRVLATFFDLLEDLSPREAMAIVADGLKHAGGRRR